MSTLRQDAELDQFAALLRDERAKLLKLHARAQRDSWWTDPHKIHDLCLYMVDQCGDRDEITQTIHWVLSEPWKYRTEYVIATCKQRDTK